MLRSEKAVLAALRQPGSYIRRAWGGYLIMPSRRSVKPDVVANLEAAGAIKRTDDGSSRVGEEWARK